YVNEPLRKTGRVDLRFEHYPRDVFSPVKYRAFQGERAGVKFRGSNSFWQLRDGIGHDQRWRKMPFSVRCEEPHRILNDSATRHLYLGTGYRDISLMRNKLSYDLFKAMGEVGGEPRPAPDIDWAEVFVNGRYRGLYELGTRVDRHLLGWDRYDPEGEDPALLYKFEGGNNLGEVITWAVKLKHPPRFYGTPFQPYEKLVEVIAGTAAEEFAGEIGGLVDIPAVIDWQLILNYANNLDGNVDEFYLARAAGKEARFSILPWDYDKTFAGKEPRWLTNALPGRLMRDYPGYQQQLADRWRELRREPFSEAAIGERIDEMGRHLAGYARWDYRRWDERYSRGSTLAEAVAELRRRALERLVWMDEILGVKAGGS
ncbi:MAG: CotH kinase family protein, partial [Candidatus Erginobacter occultus]|nr:CotH kinase family protein [Candidatus Erginobacter occultus]